MFSNPSKNLLAFSLEKDSIVADLGAGTGYYTIPLGKILTRGKVYAIEVSKDYLSAIKQKTADAGLKNVEIIWGNVEKIGGTKIGDGILDAVIASNILFQVEDKKTFCNEIKRILKTKGKVLLIDWTPESILGKKGIISKEQARATFEASGFVLMREIDAGEHHYGMILIKN